MSASAQPAAPDVTSEVISRVDAQLASFLGRQRGLIDAAGLDLTPMTEAAHDLVFAGGKRMRPLFAYWGWRCVHAEGAAAEDELITAAAALELLHVAALVHDDLIDASATRRGRPTAHTRFAALAEQQEWPGPAPSFGAAAAILLGDLLLSWSASMLDSAVLPAAGTRSARAIYDAMAAEMMAGQYLDILEQARGTHSVESALRVARFKASKYTVERPVQFGACAAGATEDVIRSLSDFGIPLGEAFQLRDDILGVFGDPARTGKPAGDDLREGKRTVLVALALDAAEADVRRGLEAVLGQPDLDDARLDEARLMITATGALERVEQMITERREAAVDALALAVIRPDARAALTHLADAATRRDT